MFIDVIRIKGIGRRRRRMKKVVELLEEAKRFADIGLKNDVIWNINDALEELENPLWYTSDQWEWCTGKPWPENGAVYYRCSRADCWVVSTFEDAKRDIVMSLIPTADIVCATEAGPPPNDWKPEENNVAE
jgi:hypothetical protein